MKLTKLRAAPVRQAEVPPCALRRFAAARTASQLIPGVRQTRAGRLRFLEGVVALSMAAVCLIGAGPPGTVQIYADGKLRGAFEARGEPYASDGPSVLVYLDQQGVKTADGLAVAGFDFIGWPEGQGVRVQVLLLVPAKGEAESFIPEGKTERLARRYFISVLLAKGDEVVLSRMRELGVTPMKLRLR